MPLNTRSRARNVIIDDKFVSNLETVDVFLPQRVVVVGQGAKDVEYTTSRFEVETVDDVGREFGYGSPVHLAVLELQPNDANGLGEIPLTVYGVEEGPGSVAADATVSPSGIPTTTGTIKFLVNGEQFGSIFVETTDDATTLSEKIFFMVVGNVNAPFTGENAGTSVTLESKWRGLSANDITLTTEGEVDGLTITITPFGNATGTPSFADALSQFKDEWETVVLNCATIAETSVLDELQVAGENRWSTLIHKPFVAFTGNTATTVDDATVVSDVRQFDRVNCQLVAPGSPSLPLLVAARQLLKIVLQADTDPTKSYSSLETDKVVTGADPDQWGYEDRDVAVKRGSSTVKVVAQKLLIDDVVTMYHPDGVEDPPYRYVADLMKIWTVIYAVNKMFVDMGYDGAPLIPDGQSTSNPDAKTPIGTVTDLTAVLVQLQERGVIEEIIEVGAEIDA